MQANNTPVGTPVGESVEVGNSFLSQIREGVGKVTTKTRNMAGAAMVAATAATSGLVAPTAVGVATTAALSENAKGATTILLESPTGGMLSVASGSYPRTTDIAGETLETHGTTIVPANSGAATLTFSGGYFQMDATVCNTTLGLPTDMNYEVRASIKNLTTGATIILPDPIIAFDGQLGTTFMSSASVAQLYETGLRGYEVSTAIPNSSTSDVWEFSFTAKYDIQNIGVGSVAFLNAGGFTDTSSGKFNLVVPEPDTALLTLLGAVGVLAGHRRRNKASDTDKTGQAGG